MKKLGVVGAFLAYSGLSLVILELSGAGYFRPALSWVEKPLVAVKRGLFSFQREFFFLSRLAGEDETIAGLKSRILNLSSAAGQVASLSAENTALRAQLGLGPRQAQKLVEAGPLGISGGVMTVDVGASDGVAVGDAVVYGDVLIGRVALTTSSQAKVLLPISSGEKIPVVTRRVSDGVRQAAGLTVGQGNEIILDQVIQSDPLAAGDLVMTDGQGFPRDMVVGTVADVLVRENELFKEARVLPAADYARLERVFVVLASSGSG